MLVCYFINQHLAQSIHIRTEEEFERITEAVIQFIIDESYHT